MIALICCIALVVIALVFAVLAIVKSDWEYWIITFIILLLDGTLGFGVVCGKQVVSSEEVKQSFCYSKTYSVVTIQTPSRTEAFTDAYTYKSVNDSSKVYLHTDYNVYGGEVKSYLVIK